MVTISITAEAFAAIETTLPKGSKAEARPDGKGGLLVTQLGGRHLLIGVRRRTIDGGERTRVGCFGVVGLHLSDCDRRIAIDGLRLWDCIGANIELGWFMMLARRDFYRDPCNAIPPPGWQLGLLQSIEPRWPRRPVFPFCKSKKGAKTCEGASEAIHGEDRSNANDRKRKQTFVWRLRANEQTRP
jgi:hypothetical protein